MAFYFVSGGQCVRNAIGLRIMRWKKVMQMAYLKMMY